MGQYRNYSDEDVIKHAKEVKSLAALLKALGLRPAGGNYAHMKYTLQRLKINTEHWGGQAWNKEKQLKDWSKYTNVTRLKIHLIKLRGHSCQCCNSSDWLETPIPLEVHHKDGDRTNNELKNLQLLCPNCHALTDHYRNRKIKW